jgi:TRAP-type C4-dicarboxylate transport system permease large subunit
VGRISIEQATRAMLPFYVMMVLVLLLVTFVPELVLTIPEAVMGVMP